MFEGSLQQPEGSCVIQPGPRVPLPTHSASSALQLLIRLEMGNG